LNSSIRLPGDDVTPDLGAINLSGEIEKELVGSWSHTNIVNPAYAVVATAR
jgi:hypothetical protein